MTECHSAVCLSAMEKNWRCGRWVITHCKVAMLPCDHINRKTKSLCGQADRPKRFIWRAMICADPSGLSVSWPHGDCAFGTRVG